MGHVPWSPQLQRIMATIKARGLIVRLLKGANINTRYIKRELKKAKIPFTELKSTIEAARQKYKNALKRFDTFKKQAQEARTSFLEELADAIAKEKGEKPASVIKQLHTRERQREAARAIRRVHGKLSGSGSLSMVIAPDPEDHTRRMQCTTKKTIESACAKENQRRFWQASHTPFVQQPLLAKVGKLNEGTGATEILEHGTITLDNPEDLDPGTKELIRQLQRPPGVRDLTLDDVEITPDRHIASWRKAKERTSSGDKIMHFGHCIACTKNQHLAKFEAIMRNIPFRTGYTPERWKRCVCVEILKKPGEFNVEKLRTIVLMAADFNDNNKIMGRSWMKHAEAQRLIDQAQQGCRKGKAAIIQATNKKLTYDLFRQTKTNGAVGSNDAKSCFDRIVHSVAMLAMRRIGFPKEPLQSMFGTIQEFELYVRTLFGDSLEGFDCSKMDLPIQSILQGNGSGPFIWTAVSSPLLKAMREKGIGAKFKCALVGNELFIVAFMFVDDNDLPVTADPDSGLPEEEEVTKQMQTAFDSWQELLHSTGGGLVAEKSNWTMIHFKWNKDGTFYYASKEE